jgi:hypothetical protein
MVDKLQTFLYSMKKKTNNEAQHVRPFVHIFYISKKLINRAFSPQTRAV